MLAMGVPLAAAQLLPRTAYAYHVPQPEAQQAPNLRLELSLGEIRAVVARLVAALQEELAVMLRGLFLFSLFLPAIVTAPICLLADVHRERWLQLLLWTLERAGAWLQGGGRLESCQGQATCLTSYAPAQRLAVGSACTSSCRVGFAVPVS
jgi:hypothetical protein